jgi:hypothetical protein
MIIAHDQEPLCFDAYCIQRPEIRDFLQARSIDAELAPDLNLGYCYYRNYFSKKVLLHSEIGGPDLDKYQQHGSFVPCFFWSHSLIAADWYRYAKADPELARPRNIRKLFNCYARAWSGSREYRLKFLDMITRSGLGDHCEIRFSTVDQGRHYQDHEFSDSRFDSNFDAGRWAKPNNSGADASATYSAQDYRRTLFDVVCETVIDRVHPTEKILRAIACGQPFVVMAGAGTLAFLRSYGFQTYESCVDESYDLIQDPVARMQAVVETMQAITESAKDPDWVAQVESIADWNRRWFFSDRVTEKVIADLIAQLEESLHLVEKSDAGEILQQAETARTAFRDREIQDQIKWAQARAANLDQ